MHFVIDMISPDQFVALYIYIKFEYFVFICNYVSKLLKYNSHPKALLSTELNRNNKLI